jgi:hypothetical protein
MRALPADSFEYFGEMALGNAALVVAAADGVATGAAAAGVAAASGPQLALRKSCHVFPARVPALCAALYLALHSLIVRAAKGCVAITLMVANSAALPTHVRVEHGNMAISFDASDGDCHKAVCGIVLVSARAHIRVSPDIAGGHY